MNILKNPATAYMNGSYWFCRWW